jgi:iron complex outermembrane recepter protein
MISAPRPLALAVSIALAQAGPALSQQRTPPPPDPVQSLSPVFITGSPLGSSLFDLADPVNQLAGRELLLKQQPTLGTTLGQEVGVSETWFGPNASRPLIRGLGGFDLRLLNNGLGVLDASAASPDHAVAVSPFAVERIEVVRGPATVMYGGAAIGGVVNTIDSRIARDPSVRGFDGAASYRFDNVSDLSAGGARLAGGTDRFRLSADGYASRNQDLKIPGYAWTGQVQTQRGEPGPQGRLPNSQGDSQTWGIGATALLDQHGYAGLSYSRYTTEYGTVAEPDVTIDLTQSAWNFESELRDSVPGLQSLRLKFGYSDYEHTEFEGGEAGTVFESKGWNIRAEALHKPWGPLVGAVGLEAANVDFSALGDEAFVPSTTTENFAGFIYEEFQEAAWKFSFGARIERVKIDAEEFTAAGLPADSASFTPWSGALGAFYAINPDWGVGANLQYTQRAPSSQELFANGPHLATNQFEVGSRSLDKVGATSMDLTLRRRGEGVTGSISGFFANFSDFIGLFPTDIWRNPEDRSVVAGPDPIVDPATGEEVVPLQQFDYRQVQARFYGIELEAGIPLWRAGGQGLTLGLQLDYVRAENRDNGEALPFIPPLRAGASLTYRANGFTAAVAALRASKQDRVPQFQTDTPGYTNLSLNASYRFTLNGASLEAFVQANNLLDETIRYSTSNLKDIAPAGARSLMAGLRGTL